MIGLLVLIHLNADKDLVRYVALIAHFTQMGELRYEEVRALVQSRTATIWWRREMSPDILAPELTYPVHWSNSRQGRSDHCDFSFFPLKHIIRVHGDLNH